ncbi:MAG TPA: 5-formyltetrahydrofolate cyclo-ligase [Acidisoma sp.]|uniref:5-formyltetrahydrofolate cyclo-ligase n=1 Tax=Acidisoma sp. TaxID=1872115 RepID=UPI002CE364AD|nr:5-formyltetrahydrofolate cyclo-ligase [Acidisoma sp.]HTI00647.1 5-formyltetrahydrofolate cyclo-ligase [Acidisoma sp.]
MAAPHTPPFPTEDPALIAAKAAARREASAARAGREPALGQELARHFLAGFQLDPGLPVSGFWPMGDEIDIRPLLHALHARGHPIGLPVTGRRGAPLVFRTWTPGAPMTPGRFGTSHPEGPELTPAALLIPLLAFDAGGRRLGYGGGFYDRTLALLPEALRIGCAYEAQEVSLVPTGPFDQKLHAIATEAGVRRFAPSDQ